ncbi:agmatinase [Vallitalea okinawensis]|uniref:agmatinase n=1 Tax=Vallitalea okinawensis TaxID=2078660 RepID=UPI000CFE1F93|nr:agmatinase [Vallitalea okinawensis]
MSLNKIGNFIGFDESFDEAKLVIFGAPFDGTTSFRPGTRFGPNVMRLESDGIETYSPYLEKDLEDYKLHDAGDLDFPFGNRDEILKVIENYTRTLINHKKIPFMIGGEHLVSYPAVKAVFDKYKDLKIIHLDAHADLRQDYLGEKLSHATVMRRIWDLVGDNKIYQFGIRSGEREEFNWAKEHVYMQKFNIDGVEDLISSIGENPVYITIDLDVLDPSIFPGTGTPEAGGVTFKELLKAIQVFEGLNIVGADIVELSPHYDQTGVSTAVACKVLRELVLAIL